MSQHNRSKGANPSFMASFNGHQNKHLSDNGTTSLVYHKVPYPLDIVKGEKESITDMKFIDFKITELVSQDYFSGPPRGSNESKANPTILRLRLELTSGSITEAVDYRKELSEDDLGGAQDLVRKCSEIARVQVAQENKTTFATHTLESLDSAALEHGGVEGEKCQREKLNHLKYAIVKKWAEMDKGEG